MNAHSNYEFSFESGQDDFQFGFESGVGGLSAKPSSAGTPTCDTKCAVTDPCSTTLVLFFFQQGDESFDFW